MSNQTAPRGLVILAFAAIYLIWGSTYLRIGFAVQTIPPHIMAGIRFALSGAVMYAFLRWRGVPNPKRVHWRSALIISIFLLGLGNGSVSWAETMVPTGLAALVIAITPLWMVLMEWLRPNGIKPRTSVFVGIALGFVGMALLIGPSALGLDHPINLVGVAIIISASLSWAFGSIYSRQAQLPESPFMLTAMEMLLGGLFLLGMSVILNEWNGFQVANVSTLSLAALLYLIVIGSFVAFTAYVYLLQVSTPAKISTYAYVNPVVAVFLGWALNGETITPITFVAAAITILGVAIITYFNTRPQPKRETPPLPLEKERVPRVALDEPKTAHR